MSAEPVEDDVDAGKVRYLPGYLPFEVGVDLDTAISDAYTAVRESGDVDALVGQHVGICKLVAELNQLADTIAGRVARLADATESKRRIDTPYGPFIVERKAATKTTDWGRTLDAMENRTLFDPETGERIEDPAVEEAVARFRQAVVAVIPTSPSVTPKSAVNRYIAKDEVVTVEWNGGYRIRPA